VKFTLKCLDLFLLGCVVLGAHFSGVLIKDRPAKVDQIMVNYAKKMVNPELKTPILSPSITKT
jgi:hypothetical protein